MSLVALAQQQSLALASRHHNHPQWRTSGQLNAGLAVGLSYALKRFMPADLVLDKDRVVSLFILIAAGASYVASGASAAYFVQDAPSGQADASQAHYEVVTPAEETDCTLNSSSGPELVKCAGDPAGRRSTSIRAREGSSSGGASNSQGGRGSEQGNSGGHDRGVSGGAGGDQPPPNPNRQGDLRRSDRIARRRPTPAPGPALPVPHKPRRLGAVKEEESTPPPFDDPPPPPPPPPQINAPMDRNNGHGAGVGLALIIGAILAGVALLLAIRRAKQVARKVRATPKRKARGEARVTSLDLYKARAAVRKPGRRRAGVWREKAPVDVYDPFAVAVFNRGGAGRYPVCPNIEGQLSASLRTPENPYLVRTEVVRPRVVVVPGTKLSCPLAAQLQVVREHPATVFLAKVYGWGRHCAGVLYAAFWAAPGARYIAQLVRGVGLGVACFFGTSALVAWNEWRMGREDNGWWASPFARAPLIPRMEQWDLREERRQEERRRRREERAARRRAEKAPERNEHVQAVAVAVDAIQHEVAAEAATAQVVAVVEDAVLHEEVGVAGSSRAAVIVPSPASEGDDDGEEEFHSAVTSLDLSVVEEVEAAFVAAAVTDAGVVEDASTVEEEVAEEVMEEEEKREVVVAAASDIVQDHKSEVGKVHIEAEEDKMDEWRKAVLALASWAPLPAISETGPVKAKDVAAERVVVVETAAPATALVVAEVADAVEEMALEDLGVVDDSDKNNIVVVQGSRRHRARPKKKAKKADTAEGGQVKGTSVQDRVVLGDIKNLPATNATGTGRAVKPAVVVARQRRRAQPKKASSTSGTA